MYYAQNPGELLNTREITELSGLDFMIGVLEGRLPGPAIAQTLGYHLHSVEQGCVVFRGTPEFSSTNPLGTVHGGWYGTVLDSAMACAVMTGIPKGCVYTTLEYKINIMRPIPLGMTVECTGTVNHVGRSTGVARGEIHGIEDGKLYATGSTTCIVMDLSRD